MRLLVRFLGFLFAAGTILFLVGVGGAAGLIWHAAGFIWHAILLTWNAAAFIWNAAARIS